MKVFGIGGHAKVVIHAAKAAGISISNIHDDNVTTHGKKFEGILVKGSISEDLNGESIVAVGDNRTRKEISRNLSNCQWKTVIHPSAIIAEDVRIGKGSVIMAGAIIQPGVKIGNHVILNTGSCVDHDCTLGDFVHVGPNCGLAGGIEIGEGAFVGIGTSIIPYVLIGEWSVIGGGAAVINDIPKYCTAVGNPAKPIKFHNE